MGFYSTGICSVSNVRRYERRLLVTCTVNCVRKGDGACMVSQRETRKHLFSYIFICAEPCKWNMASKQQSVVYLSKPIFEFVFENEFLWLEQVHACLVKGYSFQHPDVLEVVQGKGKWKSIKHLGLTCGVRLYMYGGYYLWYLLHWFTWWIKIHLRTSKFQCIVISRLTSKKFTLFTFMFFQESFFPSKRARKCPMISTWVFSGGKWGVGHQFLAQQCAVLHRRGFMVQQESFLPLFTSILYISRFRCGFLSIFFTFMKGVHPKKNYRWYRFDGILGFVLISLGSFERRRNLLAICFWFNGWKVNVGP